MVQRAERRLAVGERIADPSSQRLIDIDAGSRERGSRAYGRRAAGALGGLTAGGEYTGG